MDLPSVWTDLSEFFTNCFLFREKFVMWKVPPGNLIVFEVSLLLKVIPFQTCLLSEVYPIPVVMNPFPPAPLPGLSSILKP